MIRLFRPGRARTLAVACVVLISCQVAGCDPKPATPSHSGDGPPPNLSPKMKRIQDAKVKSEAAKADSAKK